MRFSKKLVFILLALAMLDAFAYAYADDEETFKAAEIRTIRPRFFNKKYRFELGVQAAFITNQTFYYTLMGNISLGFHITEQFALELGGGYGLSLEKHDRVLLSDDFDIETQFAPTEYFYGGSVLWTPMYGKYQLRNGHLVYFDTFLSAGGGIIGLREKYEHCHADHAKDAQVINYPYFEFGVGQRFFLTKNDSIRWDIKAPMFSTNSANSSCFDDAPDKKQFNYNVNVHLGYSRFI